MMKRLSGLKILDEREGDGPPAQKGDRVIYNCRIFLNKGDEVMLNAKQIDQLPQDMIRDVEGARFVDRKTVLGSRQTIAGLEPALIGMKVGGYRKVRISPHLAYREKGIPDLIPPGAVLVVEIWLRAKIETA
ncbi:MAG: FKBP-type peptidyl-prolyl cis-trans isomerase [Nitrospira sp.]|nr:FKBP-type peptidyl-prolyl cis-trans isomerase [Nitrospira sp.]MBH0188968.1 FKBP-type peptidyl-prolyl cis-trans isomerase [Nitrospira sp.]MBH0195010.1 FKBP-type peptidyl-prolyl cis-trans isomerase [Nitrospira sp.]